MTQTTVVQHKTRASTALIIWRAKIDALVAIWRDAYPPAKPRKHSLIEKLLCTMVLAVSLVSLSNFKDLYRAKSSNPSRNFMDIYILSWMALLSFALFSSRIPAAIATALAIYRIVDVVDYRLFFLLVKSQEKPWMADLLRRSIVIALLNFYEVMTGFAILYVNTHSIVQVGAPSLPLTTPGSAFYYSMVTMVTLGYGDYVPATAAGKGLVVAQLSTTVLFLIFLVPALVSVLSPTLTNHKN